MFRRSLALALICFGSQGMAAQQTIDVDKGQLKVVWNDAVSGFEVDYDLGRCSGSRLNVSESGTGIVIEHAGRHCPSGAEITIQLNPNDTDGLNVRFGHGIIDLRQLAGKASRVSASVKYGTIESNRWSITPSENYVGASVSGMGSGPYSPITVTVTSGVLKI